MQSEMFANNRDWPHNNMKKWRVRSLNTKWKWFLYDTDFGFGTTYSMDNSNIFSYVTNANGTSAMGGFGMGGSGNGESTLLMRKLIKYTPFTRAFVNRFCVLLTTYFTPERLLEMVNSLQAQVQQEMARDQELWGFNASDMDRDLETVKSFAQSRGQQITTEMETYFSLSDKVPVTISSSGSGKVLVEGLPLNQASVTVNFYRQVPVTLTAKAENGIFAGWSDGVTDATRMINPGEVTAISAVFK